MIRQLINGITWLTDNRGNRVSIRSWRSEEDAERMLTWLTNNNCTDCVNCEKCENCVGCYDCSSCFSCSRCSNCYRCSGCSDCVHCESCNTCSDCFDCISCSGCTGCIRCHYCELCSNCQYLKSRTGDKEELKVPVIQDIHRKVYEAINAEGCSLDMHAWHICDTTHCRAGWVTVLAGDAGIRLDNHTTTLYAAQQIYKASGYNIPPARFFDSNDDAMEDIKKLALDFQSN